MKRNDPADPKGLVAEAFRIEGIGVAECRSILLDWALSLPDDLSARSAAAALLDVHADRPEDHPMKAILREAGAAPPATARRGGARARRRGG